MHGMENFLRISVRLRLIKKKYKSLTSKSDGQCIDRKRLTIQTLKLWHRFLRKNINKILNRHHLLFLLPGRRRNFSFDRQQPNLNNYSNLVP